MTEISLLKYIQWRPIGVCDSGEGRERKAKIFSKVDLEAITNPEIKRGNWKENPKVMRIIRKYANDVAKLSTLTKGMKNPEIAEVKLVGAVLKIDETPNLNKESVDGRVQFFQVYFKDKKTNKSISNKLKKFLGRSFIAFGIFLSIILGYIIFNLFSELSFKKKYIDSEKCGYQREKISYLNKLIKIRKSLLNELNSLPEWFTFKEARKKCNSRGFGIKNEEKIFLGCFVSVKNRTKNIKYSSLSSFKKMELCAISLCENNLNHLSSLCKSF